MLQPRWYTRVSIEYLTVLYYVLIKGYIFSTQYDRLNSMIAEFVKQSDGIFTCRMKRLKPTREFRLWTFIDNMHDTAVCPSVCL